MISLLAQAFASKHMRHRVKDLLAEFAERCDRMSDTLCTGSLPELFQKFKANLIFLTLSV